MFMTKKRVLIIDGDKDVGNLFRNYYKEEDVKPFDVPGGPRVVRAAGDRARGGGVGDRGPSAGERHRPRLVLPRPLQQHHRRATGRAGRRGGVHHRDGEVGEEHVLLRRGRRPHVDGRDPRHAHQREPDRAGAGHRRRDGRHELPVLHGHDVGRSGRGPRRDSGQRDGHQRGAGGADRGGAGRAAAAGDLRVWREDPLRRRRATLGGVNGSGLTALEREVIETLLARGIPCSMHSAHSWPPAALRAAR